MPRELDLERELEQAEADAAEEFACKQCEHAGECELYGGCLLEILAASDQLSEAA